MSNENIMVKLWVNPDTHDAGFYIKNMNTGPNGSGFYTAVSPSFGGFNSANEAGAFASKMLHCIGLHDRFAVFSPDGQRVTDLFIDEKTYFNWIDGSIRFFENENNPYITITSHDGTMVEYSPDYVKKYTSDIDIKNARNNVLAMRWFMTFL